MALSKRWALSAAAATAVLVGVALVPASSAGAVNPNLAKNSHGRTASGKLLPHVSGGTEVAFADERAAAADGTNAQSDGPPDGAASAIGCANRGSATNPRVNQDCTARRQAEEQVAVNPMDATNVIAGQNDSRIGFNHCGFDYSLSRAQQWGDGIPPYFQHLSPVGHTYDAASDPNVTFAGTGTAWYSCVVFDINSNASGLLASPSTPLLKGSAYANIPAGLSNYVVAETADGHTFYDKQFMAGDRRSGNNTVYITFTKFVSDQKCSTGNNPGAYCSSEIQYSKWTGSPAAGSWSTPVTISGNSPLCTTGNTFDKQAAPDACNFNQGSMPVVLADGSAYVVWNNGNTPTLVNQTLGRRILVGGGLGPVTKVGVDNESNIALCDFGRGPEECVKSLNVRTNDFPAIAVNPSDSNKLTAVWQDSRASAPGAGHYDVVVSDSTDGGQTWSDGDGGGTVLSDTGTYFQPSVAITRSGKAAVSFYRANPYDGTVLGGGTYGYGYRTRPGSGGSFTAYQPASDGQAYPGPQANPTQKGFLGDYSSIASAAGQAIGGPDDETLYAVWSDTRNSSGGKPDEDVFVKRIALGS